MNWECRHCGFETTDDILFDTHVRGTDSRTNCVIYLLKMNQMENQRIILLLENLYTNLREHTGGWPLKDIEKIHEPRR